LDCPLRGSGIYHQEYWSYGVLEYWSNGVLEFWKKHIRAYSGGQMICLHQNRISWKSETNSKFKTSNFSNGIIVPKNLKQVRKKN